ncbi:MAG: maltooligosyl trehalose synthase [Herpetosiphonaceae bacterium]|nr:MAG: maltooligosyl trehalose synthase [Herpetosiphonaceae bacterium]
MINADEMQAEAVVSAIAAEILSQRRIPCATYRLQFNQDFTFYDAAELIPYLYDLGISDCYASPLLKPRSGSSHGYDICDHGRLNPALGGEEGFEIFSAALRQHHMGLILDTVPNHMGIGGVDNDWWMDVLENGPSSSYASYFDIDWNPVKPELQNKVLLPILGDQYGAVLESGQLRLAYEEGAFFIYYYAHKLPVAPRTYSIILNVTLEMLQETMGDEDEALQEFLSILTALGYLPPRTERDPDRLAERYREKEIIKRRITQLYTTSSEVRSAIDRTVEIFNGNVGDPHSFDLLDTLIDAQAYRPAFWRVAMDEINYRRFFDINDLAAIRVELPEVFLATHQLIFRLLAEGKASGLRIDHPDGLWNPPAYFLRLQENYVLACVVRRLSANGGAPEALDMASEGEIHAWLAAQMEQSATRAATWPLYVVVEKILSRDEQLPRSWAVYGTTGYDFANAVNGIFVDSANERFFSRLFRGFTGVQGSFATLVNSTKKQTMLIALSSEIVALSHELDRISETNRRYKDFTLNSLTFAIREVVACLPIYRTYINALTGEVSQRDRLFIEAAVDEAKRRNPRTAESIFDFIRDTLLLRNLEDFGEPVQPSVVNWVMKFQQLTGPVMAKGVEDTAFYIYNRLVSLNEVGGHPEDFGLPVDAFHAQNLERARRWPHTLLSTSTHDTKRSEDVRARINTLSEMPDEWRAAVFRWSRLNAAKKTEVDGRMAPDRNDEYLLYQTLVGAWPDDPVSPEEFDQFRERIAAYMIKAANEAKVHTSWINPNQQYQAALRNFVFAILDERRSKRFLNDIQLLRRRVAFYGRFNSLSQLLLKLTSPGVPDIYQGTELWDLSLVDPDNRRWVDYGRRRKLLDEIKRRADGAEEALTALARELLENCQDGRIKLYLTYQVLNCRRAHERLFTNGDYQPLEARGMKARHVCAFARTLDDQVMLVVAPRLVVGLTHAAEHPPVGEDIWKDTWLDLPAELHPADPGYRYRNLLTGEVLEVEHHAGKPNLRLSSILATFPAALLERIHS